MTIVQEIIRSMAAKGRVRTIAVELANPQEATPATRGGYGEAAKHSPASLVAAECRHRDGASRGQAPRGRVSRAASERGQGQAKIRRRASSTRNGSAEARRRASESPFYCCYSSAA